MRSPADRRCKPDGEHLDNPVRGRFTDTEFERLERHAATRHEGVLAHVVRECTLLGMELIEQRQRAFAESLEKDSPENIQREALQALMAQIVDKRISDQLARRLLQQHSA